MAQDSNDPTVFTSLENTGTMTQTGAMTATGALTATTGVRSSVQELTASGAFTITNGTVLLNHASVAVVATIPALSVGDELVVFDNSASGTAAHTLTLTGQTYNGSNTIATLNAPGEALHLRCIAADRLVIVVNTGAVGLSGP